MQITNKNFKLKFVKKIIKKKLIFFSFSNPTSVNKHKIFVSKNKGFTGFNINKSLLKHLLDKSILKSVSSLLLGSVTLYYSHVFKNFGELKTIPFLNSNTLSFFLLKNKIYSSRQLNRVLIFKFIKKIRVFRDFLKLKLKTFSILTFSK